MPLYQGLLSALPLPALVALPLMTGSVCAQQPPQLQADDRVGELLARSVIVTSIDPNDDDFADLQPLKQLIGDSRLVVLGEQSHGDGAVFYAKARLIKFLHQEMGFDVLTWESGMYECRNVDRALKNPVTSFDDIATMGIFPIWTFSAQVRPTLEYVRSTLTSDRPMETAGFDHQFSGGDVAQRAAELVKFFDTADATLLTPEMRSCIVDGFAAISERGPNGLPSVAVLEPLPKQWHDVGEFMDRHRDVLVKAHGEEEYTFMRRCHDDAIVSAKSMLEYVQNQGRIAPTLNNTRDIRMGENLIWQINERYKGRRIIAWMATMHAVHDLERISFGENADFYKGVINCGGVAHKAIGEQMYTIGFTSFDGKAGNVWARTEPWTLPAPSHDSLEYLCGQSGKPFLFIDFRSLPADHWLRKPIVSRPLGYGEMTATTGWPQQMDAMFYVQTMFPSTRENMLPPYAVLRSQ